MKIKVSGPRKFFIQWNQMLLQHLIWHTIPYPFGYCWNSTTSLVLFGCCLSSRSEKQVIFLCEGAELKFPPQPIGETLNLTYIQRSACLHGSSSTILMKCWYDVLCNSNEPHKLHSLKQPSFRIASRELFSSSVCILFALWWNILWARLSVVATF